MQLGIAGSCREVIENGKTGFLVNDVDEAVKAVEKMDQICRYDCRQRVEELFSSEIMVKNYEKVYSQIFQIENKKQYSREED